MRQSHTFFTNKTWLSISKRPALSQTTIIWTLSSTTLVTLGKHSNTENTKQYRLDNTMLERVIGEKDLWVIFDSNLSFEEHILAEVTKANSMVYLIRRSFFHLSPSSFWQLYATFVRPHLEYANVGWSLKLRKQVVSVNFVNKNLTWQNFKVFLFTFLISFLGFSQFQGFPYSFIYPLC